MDRFAGTATVALSLGLVLICCAAFGQVQGTANVPLAEPWQAEGVLGAGEIRLFEGGNQTFAAGVRGRVGEDMDAALTLFTMDTSGQEAVAGAVRDSEATLLGLNMRWLAHRGERYTVSVVPGVEIPLDDIKGTNTDIPATATSDDIIPVLSIPIEWQTEGGTRFVVVPRYVGFEDSPEVGDETIAGFGDIIAIGGGAIHSFGQYFVHGDLQIVLDGDNSIDEVTGAPTDEVAWSVGGTWHGESEESWRVDLFVTNVAGPTDATSIIATPDQSLGIGIRASGEF
ncbi:MAG: hypothetical protein U9R79_00880 [Armatimonadota bacterium]|nr:hypothetical protein [Armatimonadota bacterium]